jgi:DNA mismatch repair protein MSH4
MRIRLKHNDKALFLDVSTIEATELIRNAKETSPSQKRDCLLSIVDKARTRAGKRFLRRNLLEPPADLKTITMRQDLVEELSSSEESYFALCKTLSTFPDLESVIAALLIKERVMQRAFNTKAAARTNTAGWNSDFHHCVDPAAQSDGASAQMNSAGPAVTQPSMTLIRNVIHVKSCLDVIPHILAVLEGCVSPMLLGIAECLRAPVLANVSHEIGLVLQEPDLRATKTEDVRFQAAFAVRAGRNGLLDVARKISQTCTNTSRGYESEVIWEHWRLP